jgi:hypothetical protein
MFDARNQCNEAVYLRQLAARFRKLALACRQPDICVELHKIADDLTAMADK